MVAKEKVASPLNLDICNKKEANKQLLTFEKMHCLCLFWKDWKNQPENICICVTILF